MKHLVVAPDGQQYVERRPLGALRSHVIAVWVQQVGSNAAPYVQRSIPHGGVQVTCMVGGPVDISGPRRGPLVDELPAGSTLVGVRFEPTVGAAFDMVSPGDLVDHSVAGEQVWGGAAQRLADQLAEESSDPWSAAAALERWLADTVDLDRSGDPVVSEFVSMCRAGTARNVTQARAQLHVSERHLRRRCRESTGSSPGELLRVLRFQRFVALSQRRLAGDSPPDESRLAAIAMSGGYADHAHLTRECRRLSGVTPSAFLATSREQCRCAHDHRASFERFPV